MADGQIEVDILGNTSDFDKAVDGLTDTVSAKTIALGSVLADLAKKAISSLAGAVSDAIDTGMSFEKSMSNVAALQQAAGATADDIARLKQAAEEYGASTQFTMTQCSDALSYMALAGWDAQKSIEELPGVLNLVAAADMDLAKASDMVTDYMSAFSKSVSDYTGEALTAIEFSDKLAYAQANSNTNAMQLGEAFKNCAANLNAAGQQMDTVTALLGTMANQGKKGSEAGTAMSAIMRDLTNAMDDGAISINGTSIAIADAKGNYRDLIDITADIERATNGMGETQRAAALSAAFTSDAFMEALAELLPEILPALTEVIYEMARHLIAGIPLMVQAAATLLQGIADALLGVDFGAMLTDLIGILVSRLRSGSNLLVQAAISLFSSITEALPAMLEGGTQIMEALMNGITELLPVLISLGMELLDAAIDLIFALVQMITDNLDLILDAALAIITAIADGIVENLPGLVTAALGIIITLVQGISEHLPELVEAAIMILETLVTFVSENTGDIVQAGLDILMALLDGLAEAAPNLWDAIQQLIDTIWNMIMETDWIGLGVQILTGLAEGLTAGLSVVWDTIQNVGGEIVGGFKDFFGIHSPSHLMRDEIGKFMLPGIPVGMEATADETAADIQSALDDVLNSIDMDAMQMQLNAAVQMQGAEAVPTGFTAGIKKEADRAEAPSSPHDSTGWDGDMIFNVSFGNEPFDRMVISAIDRANAISGGVDV